MGVHHGNDGSVEVGANAVAELQDWTYSEEDVAMAEKTSMGDSEATPLPSGCKRGSGSIKCALDDTDTNGQVALAAAVADQSGVTLHLYSDGTTGGLYEYTGTAYLSKKEVGADKTKPNEQSFDFVGVLTRTVIA